MTASRSSIQIEGVRIFEWGEQAEGVLWVLSPANALKRGGRLMMKIYFMLYPILELRSQD